jgi:DNA-binding winged helix-turn-helix (wHTH) protein
MRLPRTGGASPVRIEAENEWAWCGERRLDLTPRAFAVLHHLVTNSRRLVTKDDQFSAVWRDMSVSDALASCIRDLRRALGDDPRVPRYIETVHRRGVRFIGSIARPPAVFPVPSPSTPAARPEIASTFVGREAELARLQQCLEDALNHQRRVVFITGELGSERQRS